MPKGIPKNGTNKGWFKKGEVRLSEYGKRVGKLGKGKKRPPFSLEWRKKISKGNEGRFYSEETRKKLSDTHKGEKSHLWKGGISRRHGYRSFIESRRRVKKLNGGGSHSLIEWNDLKSKYGFMCLCCKECEPEIKLTQDHIVPISIWETYIRFHPEISYECDDIENIQPLCLSCNSIKKKRVIDYRNEKVAQMEINN